MRRIAIARRGPVTAGRRLGRLGGVIAMAALSNAVLPAPLFPCFGSIYVFIRRRPLSAVEKVVLEETPRGIEGGRWEVGELWVQEGRGDEILLHGATEETHLFCEELSQHLPVIITMNTLKLQVFVAVGRSTSESSANSKSLPELPVHLPPSSRSTLEDCLRANGVLNEDFELKI